MYAVRISFNAVLFLLLQDLSSTHVVAQSLSNDSTVSDRAVAYAVKLYAQSVSDQTLLYNGSEYKAIPYSTTAHPYFEGNGWEWGTIEYQGESYDHIPLMYDLFKDEVILNYYHQQGYVVLRLAQEKIKTFTMRGHTFIRLSGSSPKSDVNLGGFYDLLYDGSIKVLAKRKKRKYQDLSAGAGGLAYSSALAYAYKVEYFICKNDVYYPVKSKRSVMKVLQDKKEKITRLATANKLNFSPDLEAAIVTLANYYDRP